MNTDKKIITYPALTRLRNRAKKTGKVTVLTTGCYDILHLGHVIHFNYCKSRGDILVVSVGNDSCVRELKGPNRPINNESFRARMIASLEVVDYVVISEEMGIMDHDRLVEQLRPDRYVVPSTDSMLDEKRMLIEAHGGMLITCKRLPPGHLKGGVSTTQIEEQMGGSAT
ncbi:adenylyltransferase/cytidyltransferase family protein [Candidatus Latescibacterota bacterium]